MPLSEQVEQVNRQLANHLATIADELRRAMLARLREAHTSALDRLEEIRPELPASPLAPELLAELEARLTPPPPAPRPTTTELLVALRRIDGASTQSELLEGLLQGARAFCGRSALYILAEEGTRGWAAAGFGPAFTALEDSTPDAGAGSPLARLAEGAGVLRLTAEECATLVGELSADPAADGALIPLVLRDQLAAALYVDRTADGGEIDLPAIQALGYGAAQALELLGLRGRSATPTLFVMGETAALAPLPLWRETIEEEVPATEPEPTPAPVHERVEPEPLPAVDEVASAYFATSPSAAPEPAVPEPIVEPLWISAPTTPAVVPEPVLPHDMSFAPEPEAAPAASATPAVDEFQPLEVAPIDFAPEPVVAPAFELEPVEAPADVWEPTLDDTAVASVTVAEAGEVWSEPVFELAPEEEQTFELVTEEPPAVEPTFAAPVEEIPVPVEPPTPPEIPTSAEPPAPPAPTFTGFERPAEETTAPQPAQPFPWSSAASTQQVPITPPSPVRADLSEDETVMIPRSGFPPLPRRARRSPPGPRPSPPPRRSPAAGRPASGRPGVGAQKSPLRPTSRARAGPSAVHAPRSAARATRRCTRRRVASRGFSSPRSSSTTRSRSRTAGGTRTSTPG